MRCGLCSQLRSLDRTRSVPVLATHSEPDNSARMLRGLEIGVNDYLMRPIDKNELLARARSQVRKRRYTERLRDNVQIPIQMAITDALHRSVQSPLHGKSPWQRWSNRPAPAASRWRLLALDIDHFKLINDTHGHDAGDDVLRDFALRIKRSIRGIDLACRCGGEEFIIVMPETDMAVAASVAERLRLAHRHRAICHQSRGLHSDPGHAVDRASLRCANADDTPRRPAQARGSGAVSRQTRWTEPGCSGCRRESCQAVFR